MLLWLWGITAVTVFLYRNEIYWIVLLTLFSQKTVEKSIQENLKLIKNTLPNKSRNPKSLKKYLKQFESSPTNVHIIGEDLLKALCKLF